MTSPLCPPLAGRLKLILNIAKDVDPYEPPVASFCRRYVLNQFKRIALLVPLSEDLSASLRFILFDVETIKKAFNIVKGY